MFIFLQFTVFAGFITSIYNVCFSTFTSIFLLVTKCLKTTLTILNITVSCERLFSCLKMLKIPNNYDGTRIAK